MIGYLMKLRHWRLAEAYKWVKDKRPAVNISQSESRQPGRMLQRAARSRAVLSRGPWHAPLCGGLGAFNH